MKKSVWFVVSILVLAIVFALAYSWWPEASSSVASGDKEDETVIKEVVEAYYDQTKNFKWDKFDSEIGMEYWTEEGWEQYLVEEGGSFAELVKEQKVSCQLLGIDFQEINVENNEARVTLVSQEKFTGKSAEGLNGIFQGHGTLELQKIEQTWQIQSYDFYLVKIE